MLLNVHPVQTKMQNSFYGSIAKRRVPTIGKYSAWRVFLGEPSPAFVRVYAKYVLHCVKLRNESLVELITEYVREHLEVVRLVKSLRF